MIDTGAEAARERVAVAGVHTGSGDVLRDTTDESMRELLRTGENRRRRGCA